MTDKTLPRPPQVTLLGGAILVGSVFMVLVAFDRMASLGSIEEQERAVRFVSQGIGKGLGIDADQWQTVLRVLCMITGGAGVVTAFLGWQVLQRDRSARVALSVLAPVLLVAGPPTADYIATIVVVAIVLLWRQPARDWFNGIVPPKAAVRAPERSREMAPSGPPPYVDPAAWPPPQHQQDQRDPLAGRPGAVVAAAITTIVGSTIVIAMVIVGVLAIVGNRADFEQQMNDELASQSAYSDLDIDGSVITDVFLGLLVVFAVWAVVAIGLALLTLRGSNGARITLVVSAIGAALASLLGVLVVFPLVLTGACVAVAVLLMRGETATWFAVRKRP